MFDRLRIGIARGGRVVRWRWVNFQCQGVLLVWILEGQGHTALEIGAGGGIVWPFQCLSFFSLPLGDGPTYTEILSQSAIEPKTTNQPLVFNFLDLFQFFNNNAMY